MNIKDQILNNLINIPGWRTKRKILIIESDDWGSIRIPSNEVYNKLLESSLVSSHDPWSRFDNLENQEDILNLFDVLTSVKDKNGRNAVLTANFVTANPDFNKIRNEAFSVYHYEPFFETYKNYYSQNSLQETIKQGIERDILIPQYHSREHVNVQQWMAFLQKKNDAFAKAFDLGVFAINNREKNLRRDSLMATCDFLTAKDREEVNESLKDGISLFKKLWGFESASFIAPCHVWDDSIEKTLSENGIRCLQSSHIQNLPDTSSAKYKRRWHFTGQKNKLGQTYLVRNVLFEPSFNKNLDWVDICLKEISISFRWSKPAIISAHRLNFIGSRDPLNRKNNLFLLRTLLMEVKKKWPDIEFMSTNKLYETQLKQI